MTISREPKPQRNPQADALLTSLRCGKCDHFHRYDECQFPQCECPSRANYTRLLPAENVVNLDELQGNEP